MPVLQGPAPNPDPGPFLGLPWKVKCLWLFGTPNGVRHAFKEGETTTQRVKGWVCISHNG